MFHGARYQKLVAQGRKDEADRLRNAYLDEFARKSRADQDTMGTGVLDWTVPAVGDLRSHVSRAMEVARAKARTGSHRRDEGGSPVTISALDVGSLDPLRAPSSPMPREGSPVPGYNTGRGQGPERWRAATALRRAGARSGPTRLSSLGSRKSRPPGPIRNP